MKRAREQNVDVSRVIVFNVVDYFESILDGQAHAELRIDTDWSVELLPDLLMEDATVKLSVLQGPVEVFYVKRRK